MNRREDGNYESGSKKPMYFWIAHFESSRRPVHRTSIEYLAQFLAFFEEAPQAGGVVWKAEELPEVGAELPQFGLFGERGENSALSSIEPLRDFRRRALQSPVFDLSNAG